MEGGDSSPTSRKVSTVSNTSQDSKPPVQPEPHSGQARKERKKKSREEKGEGGSQLRRKPSMKKIMAFFDRNKENKEEKVETDGGQSAEKSWDR